jgi:D-glycero-D-manno-heptose 1,7-bisphosphate phosphatase
MVLILLDRDGVINHDRVDYVKSVDEFHLIDGAVDAIAAMNRLGWKIAVVTNHSCVGKGIITESQLHIIHDDMMQRLRKHDAHIDRIYFAPDHPDRATPRRKPGPGMMIEAMRDFNIPPERSFLIGDALRDLTAAMAAGCHRCLVRTGRGAELAANGLPESVMPVKIIDHLSESIDWVKNIAA